jgi:hypothetical protein
MAHSAGIGTKARTPRQLTAAPHPLTARGPHFDEHHLAPIVLSTLLHVHMSRSDPIGTSASVKSSLDVLEKHKLIERAEDDESDNGWKMTLRGKAYVAMLCKMPFPVPSPGWFNPITNERIELL